MNIGRLRHRIQFQSNTGTDKNAYGEPQDEWTTYATVWAALTPQDVSEKVEAGMPSATVMYRIACRYIEGVQPSHRILYDGKELEIIGVMNLQERSRELRIEAMERIDG